MNDEFVSKEKKDYDRIYLFISIIVFLFLGIERIIIFVDKYTVIQYMDELVVLLACPLILFRLFQKKSTIMMEKSRIFFFLLVSLYWISGWIGVYLYRFQPFQVSLKDSFLALKFFMAIITGYLFFMDICNYQYFYRGLWYFSGFVTFILTVFTIFDVAFGLFYTETRWGLPAIKLFYNHYSDLEIICVLLMGFYLRIYQYQRKKILPWIGMLSFVILCTRRTKGFAAIPLFICMILLLNHKKVGKKKKVFLGITIIVAAIGCIWKFFVDYYQLGNKSARLVLVKSGVWLAKKYFPFGSGWGTFGSAASTSPYSPIYEMCRIHHIKGLTIEDSSYITDNFWPMVLGQCGVIGLIFILVLLYQMFHKIQKIRVQDHYLYVSLLFPYLFLLICSTCEATYTSYSSVSIGLWMGLLIAERHKKLIERGESNL